MERREYEEVLSSTIIKEGFTKQSLQQSIAPLAIARQKMLPNTLYKFRCCNDDNLKALERDEIWMSTATEFNDPYDTLVQYDFNEIKNTIKAVLTPEIFKCMSMYISEGGNLPNSLSNIMDVEEFVKLRGIISGKQDLELKTKTFFEQRDLYEQMLLNITEIIPEIIQRLSFIACFSEDVHSMLMWSHYSQKHEGFALGYEGDELISLSNQYNAGLFPVIYSQKRYNPQEYLLYIYGKLLSLPIKNPDILGHIKILSHKAKEWEYEKEWRLILHNEDILSNKKATPLSIAPKSIYYGCRIKRENYQKLHDIAKEKGLKEYKMKIDVSGENYRVSFDYQL